MRRDSDENDLPRTSSGSWPIVSSGLEDVFTMSLTLAAAMPISDLGERRLFDAVRGFEAKRGRGFSAPWTACNACIRVSMENWRYGGGSCKHL